MDHVGTAPFIVSRVASGKEFIHGPICTPELATLQKAPWRVLYAGRQQAGMRMAVNPFFLKLGTALSDSVSVGDVFASLSKLLLEHALANRVELALYSARTGDIARYGVPPDAAPLAGQELLAGFAANPEAASVSAQAWAGGGECIHWPITVKNRAVGCLSVVLDPLSPGGDAVADMMAAAASFLRRSVTVADTMRNEYEELLDENYLLREEIRTKYRPDGFVWVSGAMEDIFQTAMRVSASSATVLIRGETGTGKEMLANMIHYHSPRANKPFVKVNCAALTETLLESELFGHARGAFTGANTERKGRFEAADGGTIFLDEIGDISPRLQISLLRVLQEREITRVGDNLPRKVDVRIIAATHRNLEEKVQDGSFRADLYYRLNVVYLAIPPLRERREDILPMVELFLSRYNQQNFKCVEIRDPDVLALLAAYDWPGNVRELQNAIEKAIVLAPSNAITKDLLPSTIAAATAGGSLRAGAAVPAGVPVTDLEGMVRSYIDPRYLTTELPHGAVFASIVSRVERVLIEKALGEARGCQIKASRALGINRNTIRKKIADYGIDVHRHER